MKVLTIGGATQDIFLHYEGSDFMTITKKNTVANFMLFESGEKKELSSIHYKTGGGATNAAVSFKRLGFDTCCFCSIGNDAAGKAVLEKLTQEGINTKHIHIHSDINTGQSFIINSQKGESTVFAYRGANTTLEKKLIPFDHIQECNYVYITSLSHSSALVLPEIVTFAKKNKVPVAINPGVSQLAKGTKMLKESLANIDILILNSAEAQVFMLALVQSDEAYEKALKSSRNDTANGINMPNAQPYLLEYPIAYEDHHFSICQFFKEVLKMGPKIVVVTNGCNGVYVAAEKKLYFHPSLKINVINSVGAGDAFGSCFVASILQGCDIPIALKNGIVNSASVLESTDAKSGLLTQAALQEKAKKVDPALLEVRSF